MCRTRNMVSALRRCEMFLLRLSVPDKVLISYSTSEEICSCGSLIACVVGLVVSVVGCGYRLHLDHLPC